MYIFTKSRLLTFLPSLSVNITVTRLMGVVNMFRLYESSLTRRALCRKIVHLRDISSLYTILWLKISFLIKVI